MSRNSRMKAQKKKKVVKKKSGAETFSPFHLLSDELPIYGTWMLEGDLEEHGGAASVIIARKMLGGNLAFGIFFIDVWGVGLKDCFGNLDVSPRTFEREVLKRHPDMNYVPCHLADAQRLIWGGVAHAEKHGFKLPKEFRDWRKIVGQPPSDAPPIEFGKDGKLFVIGEINDIAKRMGTTPQKAMEQINPKGHYLFGMAPEEFPDVFVGSDGEMEALEDVDDSDVDLVVEPEPRQTLSLGPRRPRQE